MLNLQTLTAKPDPKLEGSTTSWPRNQLFWDESTTNTRTTQKDEEMQIKSSGELEGNALRDVMSLMQGSVVFGDTSQSSAPPASPVGLSSGTAALGSGMAAGREPPPQQPLLVRLRKIHAEWDRKRRDMMSVQAKSELCTLTSGTAIERELSTALGAGEATDITLLQWEIVLAQRTLDDREEGQVAALISQLIADMRTALKFASAINTLLKAELK